MPRREIVYAVVAIADLRKIHRWSVAEFGFAVADRYLSDLESAIEGLCDLPFVGLRTPGSTRPVFTLSCRSHRIVYAVSTTRVRIVRILHQAQDLQRHIPA